MLSVAVARRARPAGCAIAAAADGSAVADRQRDAQSAAENSRRSVAGSPMAISLVLISPRRVATRSTSSRLCVETMTARPRSRRSLIRSRTPREVSGSRLAVGSSSRTTSGSWTSALASASFCFIPFDSMRGAVARAGPRDRIGAAAARPLPRVGDAEQPRVGSHVVGDGELLPQPGSFGQEPDAPADARRRCRGRCARRPLSTCPRSAGSARRASAASWSCRRRSGPAVRRPPRAPISNDTLSTATRSPKLRVRREASSTAQMVS